MRPSAKKIFYSLPVSFQRTLLRGYEKMHTKEVKISITKHSIRKNILFYHVSGLSFGGTEKFLQIIAKHIDRKKYNVSFMYSAHPRNKNQIAWDGRKTYLENTTINFIPFSYSSISNKYPYRLVDAKPSFAQTVEEKEIDVIVTAGSGYTEYPFNEVVSVPIIMINIFGSPNVQPNIEKNICISNAVADKIRPIVPEEKISVMYILSERPDSGAMHRGAALRQKYGIKETDMVFGRIGRSDDAIFDEIGIRAFQKVVADSANVHYFIMSPPPILKTIVKNENIPNVHFLPASSNETDIWAFHASIDALAHFRKDGESCGLNIAESMLSKKPVITHKSRQWNAHLEYLEPVFSRVAEIDNIKQYEGFMREFISLKKTGELVKMGILACAKAEPLFLIEKNIATIEKWIDSTQS